MSTGPYIFKDSLALITGAGAGIGASVASHFAAAGATVLVNDIDPDRAAHVSGDLQSRGMDAHPVAGDVVDRDACERLIRQLLQEHGPVDILVNNAAAMTDLGLLWEMTDDEVEEGMSSLVASLNMLRWLVPTMIERRSGRIVNIGSMAGRIGVAQMPVYSAAKGALHSLTRSLALDLAGYGITINSVAPGVIDTERQQARPRQVQEQRRAEIPMGRLGSPDEVAETVVFLCSPGAAYITGEVLPIDGGLP